MSSKHVFTEKGSDKRENTLNIDGGEHPRKNCVLNEQFFEEKK